MPNRTKTHPAIRWLGIFVVLVVVFKATATASETVEVSLEGGIDVPVEVFRADDPELVLLWLPSERGVNDGMRRIAQALAWYEGIAVWLADPFAGWLLPATRSTLDEIDPDILAGLLDQIMMAEGKRVVLLSHDRGSKLALRTARSWQAENPGDARLAGAVLITPNVYARTPDVGEAGQFAAIAHETNFSVFVMQPTLSPAALWVRDVAATLGEGGARVFGRLLYDVRDRFFFRPDATEDEQAKAAELPALVRQAARLLLTEPTPSGPSAEHRIARDADRDIGAALGPYRGDNADNPPPLVLTDTEGVTRDLADLKGQVVLLNFWASWCPPCLHEMPSMERVMHRYADQGFAIAAVNLGEPEARIRQFVQELDITFPVWLDPENESARRWRVFAFPTSFLIDRRGHIRYAIAGGIEWDEPRPIALIEKLLAEPAP